MEFFLRLAMKGKDSTGELERQSDVSYDKQYVSIDTGRYNSAGLDKYFVTIQVVKKNCKNGNSGVFCFIFSMTPLSLSDNYN